MGFLINKPNRSAGSGIVAAQFQIVLFDPPGDIGCNTGIKRMVRAMNDIKIPHMNFSDTQLLPLLPFIRSFSFPDHLKLNILRAGNMIYSAVAGFLPRRSSFKYRTSAQYLFNPANLAAFQTDFYPMRMVRGFRQDIFYNAFS